MANTSNLDLVKPAGTDHALISVINSNMDKVDAYAGKVNTSLAGVEDGLAIVATGNTHAAITAGQFVYVKEHNTLPEGLYTASSNIAANATLSTTNLTADSKGGLNALSDQIANIDSKISTYTTGKLTIPSDVTASYKECFKVCKVVTLYILASKSTWSEYDLIATVPPGFRPKTTQYYVPIFNYNNTSNNDIARISDNGQIVIWSKGTQPSGNIYISATYICDD